MGNLTTALIVVLSINLMLFLGQVSMLNINPQATVFYNGTGSLICQQDQNNCLTDTYVLSDTNPTGRLPQSQSDTSPDTNSFFFTDTFASARDWVTNSEQALSLLSNILSGPKNFIMALGLPTTFAQSVSALWYLSTLFLIVAWILGRDG